MGIRKCLLAVCLAPLATGATGCIASNVLGVQERAVPSVEAAVEWRVPARPELIGLWRTTSIAGPAAALLLDLTYWLAEDGSFSGAALFAGPPPAFQTLSGRWTLREDGTLLLGEDSEPAVVEVGAGLLRLTGPEGSLTLERAEVR